MPGIAGRSPRRQLYHFKYGTRAGIGSALMKASVEKLAVEDILRLLPTRLLWRLKPMAICVVTIE
jgi:hypothetical protein